MMSGQNTIKRGTLNHLRLTVSNIAKAEKFYDPIARFMGYSLVEKSNHRLSWAGLAGHGNLQFLILSQSKKGRSRPHDRYSPGLHHVAWNAESREEVDAFYEMLLENNVCILDPPADYSYEPGYYAVFFADPDGMKLEFVHVPIEGSQVYWHLFAALGQNPLKKIDERVGCCE